MIVLTQIKAARALLGWTQKDLAQAASLSLPAINNLERGLTTPRPETLQSIEYALVSAGIDFIDQSGVQIRPPDLEIKILEGADWLKQYDDIILSNMHSEGDEICQFSCNERLWMVHGAETNHHYIHHRNKVGFKERILIPEGADFVTNLRRVYRLQKPVLFRQISWQVFGPYFSQIVWAKRQIVLIRSEVLADSQRALFNELWLSAGEFTDAKWKKAQKWQAAEI